MPKAFKKWDQKRKTPYTPPQAGSSRGTVLFALPGTFLPGPGHHPAPKTLHPRPCSLTAPGGHFGS